MRIFEAILIVQPLTVDQFTRDSWPDTDFIPPVYCVEEPVLLSPDEVVVILFDLCKVSHIAFETDKLLWKPGGVIVKLDS